MSRVPFYPQSAERQGKLMKAISNQNCRFRGPLKQLFLAPRARTIAIRLVAQRRVLVGDPVGVGVGLGERESDHGRVLLYLGSPSVAQHVITI
jgi:hypothetical protein